MCSLDMIAMILDTQRIAADADAYISSDLDSAKTTQPPFFSLSLFS